MKKIVVTPLAFHKSGEEAIACITANGYEAVVNHTGRHLSKTEFTQLAKEAEGIIVGVDQIDRDLLNHCKHLKVIVKFGVGTDNIDLEYAGQLGIIVKKTIGTNATSVAEFTIALLFACAKQIVPSSILTKQGGFTKLTGTEVKDKVIGIVGVGYIGKEVARIAGGIGMKLLAYDAVPISQEVCQEYHLCSCDLNILLEQSDFITIHVPLTKATKHFISLDEFECMKETAGLINCSRGGIVDERALLQALKNRKIAWAAADTFSTEPPEDCDWVRELLALDNFILTPHIGAVTWDAEQKTIERSTQILLETLNYVKETKDGEI